MVNLTACWNYFLSLLHLLNFSPLYIENPSTIQTSLRLRPNLSNVVPLTSSGPTFRPPNGPEHDEFFCHYPTLTEYEPCSEHDDRGCWLRPKDKSSGLPIYDIYTDYENKYPKGITRYYNLTVTNTTLYPDGCKNNQCKVFVDEDTWNNPSYPGPWIEACWGDTIEVTINNNLTCNGTTIHWHGIRMLNNVENDGVNAVTQCPIAPGESQTYRFHVRQYGSTWYHSHYALQYADGMAGPLTIHGPSSGCNETEKSGCYDIGKNPILMTDWNQRSAFEDWAWSINTTKRPKMTSILLNGQGRFVPTTNDMCKPQKTKLHTLYFQKGIRYLLRLINTSIDTTFIFSIDGHNITVIEADFVPIEPYTNTSVLIGIGQRYHVVVEANALDGDYWMRTVPADQCHGFRNDNAGNPIVEERTGIVRYDPDRTSDPTTSRNQMDTQCSDETYTSLKPIFPWKIPNPQEIDYSALNVLFKNTTAVEGPYYPSDIKRWRMHEGPMWLDFSNPTLLHATSSKTPSKWAAEMVVSSSNATNGEWIEMVILGPPSNLSTPAKPREFRSAAHPIHLHGHDFAILAQGDGDYSPGQTPLNRDNPPRRDVALLPGGGYLVIAFKLDNPGVWLMHCHIAWHASSGLAMQIKENVDRLELHDNAGLVRQCDQWNNWYNGKRNETGSSCGAWHHFQDDSGI